MPSHSPPRPGLIVPAPAARAGPGIALPRVIGHRGAAGLAPENTLAGIRKAALLGCRAVEVDAKLTACGRLILMHDDRLERTTDGSGPVARHDLAAIRRLDAGAWFAPEFAGERVPTLEETLELARDLDLRLNVEIKPCRGRAAETGRAVAGLVREMWPPDHPPPLLSSFSRKALRAALATAPDLPRGLLFHRLLPFGWARLAHDLDCATLNLNHRLLTAKGVARIKAHGMPVLAYTVDDPARARLLWGFGVDAVFTDRPDLLLPLAEAA